MAARLYHRLLLIMRLTTVILIASLMQVSAATFGQRITLNQKNASLETVLKQIHEQSGYDFYYDGRLISSAKPVDIAVQNVSVEEALKSALAGSDIGFSIKGKIVAIKRKSQILDNSLPVFRRIDVRGTVMDEKGTGLPGATVKLKGSTKVVITDEDGRFNFPGLGVGDILVCSYVGYLSQQIMVLSAENTLLIQLKLASADLEGIDVVRTGYQTLPKERATGSFKVIGKEQLDKPATSIAQRLIGTTAGLSAISDANGNTTFRIRGGSTLNTSNDPLRHPGNPLIVLDGFPMENTTINDINPNNVESITVLKDAAAASIWGSRSANGVIVITTKSGKRGIPFSADINTFTRIGKKFDLDYARNLATSAETVQFEKYAFNRWGSAYNAGNLNQLTRPASLVNGYLNEVRLGRMTQAQADAELARLSTLDNRQQIGDYILDNPISNQVNLNITASTARVTNALSALFETNSTAFKGTDNRRVMLNYRGEANIYKWLDFDVNFVGQYQDGNNNGFNMSNIAAWSPYDMLLNPDGSRVQNFNHGYYQPTLSTFVAQFGSKFPYDFYYNPLRELESRDFSTEALNFRIQAGLTGKIIPGLTVSSRIMYDNNNAFTRNLSKEDSYTVRSDFNNSITWDRTLNGAIIPNLPKGAQLAQNRSKYRGFNFRNQVDFNRTFATDHAVNFAGGAEIRSYVTESFVNPIGYGYNDETLAVGNFPNGPGGSFRPLNNWLGGSSVFPYINAFTYTTRRYYSVFANAMYTYKGKYSVSGSYRTDAANIIAATDDLRYSPFWSVGSIWQLGREDFIKGLTWIDKLALRFTYGVNGNEDAGTSPFPLINTGIANSETGAIPATISSYGNPLLRWEKTFILNAGLDFSLWNGKLYGTLEAYQKNGRDLLADVSISIVNGVASQKLNNVEMYNRGIDLELGSALQINNNLRWRGNVNFSYNDSKITKLFRTGWIADVLARGGTGAYVEDYNASTLWSYRYAGMQGGQPSLYGPNDVPFAVGTFVGGDARSWMQNSGVTVAPYTVGLNNTFDIYRFSLSSIVTGKFGHVFRRSGFNYPWIFNDRKSVNARFSEVFNGDPTQILTLPSQTAGSTTYSNWSNQATDLNYLVENASHIRLQEVSLAYNMDPRWTKKFGFAGLRLYAQGNDLLVITNNKYDEDPEFRLGSINPTPRFTFGFKLQL